MPTPTPEPGEDKDKFISRCISECVASGSDQEQAAAICYTQWENAKDMIEGHIFIQGEIIPWQDTEAAKWGGVNVKNISQQVLDNKEAENLIVHIHSNGGDVDEAFAIHDILRANGKKIETRIEGLCASSATIIALAGDKRLMTENSTFMIHNPWMWGNAGDADDLQKQADLLKEVENKIIAFYAKKTGSDASKLDTWMKEEKWMSAAEAKELGFITEIITDIKAVAKITIQKNIEMNKNEELVKSIDTKLDTFWDKIKNFLGIKMLTITAADGTVLDFGDQVKTADQIAAGMTAKLADGGVPSGDYPMPDGKVFVFDTAGKLSEIKPGETTDLEALKKENADLKAEIETLKASALAKETAFRTIESDFATFKAEIKSSIKDFDPDAKAENDPPVKSRIPKAKV